MSVRRTYETTFIINAALEDGDIETTISKVVGYVENHGGEIKQIDKWGRRRLAYPINKKYNGYYVHIIFETNSNTAPILEKFLILEDTILRHLTVALPKELRDYRDKIAFKMIEDKELTEDKKRKQAETRQSTDKKEEKEEKVEKEEEKESKIEEEKEEKEV